MLRCEHLNLRRAGQLLIEDASFELHPGQHCALTGANGTGKSSLFALIRGELEPDQGYCTLPEDWTIAHVAQETPALPHSALEHVLLGDAEWISLRKQLRDTQLPEAAIATLHERFEQIGGWQTESRAARLLHGLGFADADIHKPVQDFSGGWRMRLNLAQALLCRSDLLLLDEPTNHLDMETVLWLEQWLQRYSGTLLLISHDRQFLDAVCDHVLHLENRKLRLFRGNYSQSEHKRLEQQRLLQKQAEKTEAERAHMADFVRRFRAKASKAKQAQSRLKALEKLAPVLLESGRRRLVFDFPQPDRQPATLIKLDEVSLGWDDANPVLRNIRLTLLPGQKLGLLGPNGAGKSTLMRTLAGELQPLAGQCFPAKGLQVGYFAQHQMDRLHLEDSARSHVQRQQPSWSEQQCWDYLGRFQFSKTKSEQPVAEYSGGERARLALALVILQRPNLLLLDEPTNHLDMETREALALALNDFDGAVLLISHDRHLLQLCCDHYLHIDHGRVEAWPGNLEDWLQHMRRTHEPDSGKSDKVEHSARERRKRAARIRAQLQPLKKQCQQLEKDMDRLQTALQKIETQLLDETLYTVENSPRLQPLLQEQGQLRQQLQEKENQWLEQTAALEEQEHALSQE